MTLWCPLGAIYNSVNMLCMTGLYAVGPFSQQMMDACRAFRGADSKDCEQDNWDIFFAGALRGSAPCPPGTNHNPNWDVCVDDRHAYGPFSLPHVESCKELQWGSVCEIMKWPLAIFRKEIAPPAPPVHISDAVVSNQTLIQSSGLSALLLRHYASPENYRKVHAEVMRWFGTTRNACVAFISTALRQVGVNIPRRLNRQGYNISTWTAALSDYLEADLGWERITGLESLRPGDIAFTLDLDGSTRVPAHVFLFVDWLSESKSLARVIDNQGFLHQRYLNRFNSGSFTPFHYALRPPR